MSEVSPALKGPPPLAAHPGDALPEGARLAEFEIRRVLGAGGFGIVYLAWDHALEREVALKEYMPVTLAGRGPGQRVSIRAAAHEETFALGLKSFVNEARMLARFDHPSLVKVYRFWEDNGTAYMAMPMYHGRTLRQVRQQMAPGSPGEAWARALIDPMLDALERLHREGVFHRDIAPDNIILTDEGHAVLLDFGAARKVIGDRTHALTAILKPHFAPIEQYADVASMRQGPWTDLYGLGATAYYLLTGQPPLPAAARALHDELVPLARLQPAGCSEAFVQALDWSMSVRPQARPQSVAIFRDVLDGRMAVPTVLRHDTTAPSVTSIAVAPVPAPDFDPTEPMSATSPSAPVAGAAPASGHRASGSPLWRGFTVPGRTVPVPSPAPEPVKDVAGVQAVPAEPAPSQAALPLHRRPAALAGAAVLALALVVAFAIVIPKPASAPASPAAAPPLAGPAAAASAMPVPTPLPQPVQRAAAVAAVPVPAASAAAPLVQAPASAAAAVAQRPAQRAPANVRERPRDHERETAAPPAAARVAGPDERCANHMFLTRLICIKRECDTDPRLHNHPECVKLQKAEQERRERMMER